MSRHVQNILIIAVIILVVYLAGKYVVPDVLYVILYVLSLLVPFILAVLVSILMEPAVSFLQNRGNLPRGLAVGLTMLIILGVLSFIIGVMVVRLVAELTELSIALPGHIAVLQVYFQDWVDKGIIYYGALPPAVSEQVQQNLIAFTESIQGLLRSVVDGLIHLLSIIPNMIMFILITLIATFFISRDRHEISRLWLRIMPVPWGANTLEVSRKIAEAFMKYVRASSVLVALTTVQSIIGLHLIGSSYALTMGILIGILDMIPVLGPGTVLLPWALWSLLTGAPFFGVKLLLLYLFVQVVRAVLEPRIMAANLGLHPLAVLVSMYVGLKTIGVLGLVMGPLLVIAIQAGIKSGLTLNR
ncbi:MAG: sporulation integral membrane protein YtvI [Bacillota bacterium]